MTQLNDAKNPEVEAPWRARGVLRTREAALVLGLKEQTLRALRQRGGGPRFVRLSINRVAYTPQSLVQFLEERTFGSNAEVREAERRNPSPRVVPASRRTVVAPARAKAKKN